MSPETLFDDHAGMEADVWALGCAIYEIRTGYHLFTMVDGDRDEILDQIFQTLGKPPDAWWEILREERGEGWGEEWKEPTRPCPIHKRVSLGAEGTYNAPMYVEDGLHPLPITEHPEVRIDDKEVDLLTDLLEKMMRYRPEERITMEEVIKHPWFNM
jgi:serine/threonine protein kinase